MKVNRETRGRISPGESRHRTAPIISLFRKQLLNIHSVPGTGFILSNTKIVRQRLSSLHPSQTTNQPTSRAADQVYLHEVSVVAALPTAPNASCYPTQTSMSSHATLSQDSIPSSFIQFLFL